MIFLCTLFQPIEDEEEEEEDIDPEKYWAAIHFMGAEKDKASEYVTILFNFFFTIVFNPWF